jgi:membrane protease YdiL (CAAX protease family)
MHKETTGVTTLGQLLRANRAVQAAELVVVFAVALATITIALPRVGDNPLARQAVVWVANVLMLTLVWLGLRLRGQTWEHFGLGFRFKGWRTALRTVLKSLAVFVAAVAAFILGSVIMTAIMGTPETADMSGYDYLRGNLPLLVLALAAVYIVSSFGEEVIYRAFLIDRLAELGSGGTGALRSAVVVSAVVFGLVHVDWGLIGIVQTGFMGLALGVSYLVVRRRLWVLILAHAYMDTLLLVQLYLPAPS